ncbi:hypothetical protein CBS101457_004177 [Exobasidium rhododendri]|nr:hypothetical protein CBS101457_004177 [Exobasidium rhododendri]
MIGAPAAAASGSRPSAHAQRYDRQLRLWASSGQASLESAKILVLGASHLSACVLKNLILPGIGSFTLVDANQIIEADVGNNFFITPNSKGKDRAEEQVKNLCELNPSVQGISIVEEPLDFIEKEDLSHYTLIIAVNQPHFVLFPLAEMAWKAKDGSGVPLMTLKGYGLVGEVQVQVKEAAIIETHPDNIVDLRLTRPWPSLQEYAEKYDMNSSDTMERSHIPFVVILLRKLQEWKQEHDGNLPVPSQDRKAFTEVINSARQSSSSDDENVEEALAALGQHVWRPAAAGRCGVIPSDVRTLFEDPACESITSKTSNFWLLVRALRSFVEQGDGSLPLSGALPDMKSLSATYVELQRVYRAKANEDVTTFKRILIQVLQQVNLPVDAVPSDELQSFAKHASYLKLIRGRPLRDIIERPKLEAINAGFADMMNPNIFPHHFAMYAAEVFYELHNGRYPGRPLPDWEEDANNLIEIAEDLIVESKAVLPDDELLLDACRELARSGHSDLPSTAALLGGIAAQEAIKIVTRQYIPIDNTAVYDGVKQAMTVFRL